MRLEKETFRYAKTSALSALCKRADAGLPEALYLLDMDSGEILCYREATADAPDAVEADPKVLQGRGSVSVLHSHDVHTPPSAEDWEQLITHPAIKEVVSVTAQAIYTMQKLGNQEPVALFGKAKPVLVYYWKLRKLMDAAGFKGQKPTQVPLDQMQSFWEQVNDEMAADYGLILRREQRS